MLMSMECCAELIQSSVFPHTLMIALLYNDQYVLGAVLLVSNWLHQSLESSAVASK